jgi:phage nucleotide-binding protein
VKTTKLSEMPVTGVSCLIYSEPGMGKTTLLGGLSGRTLIMDMDHGTCVLKNNQSAIEIYHVSPDLSDVKPTFEELQMKKGCGYANICLDTGTELEKAMLVRYGQTGKNDGAPELLHYNRAQFKMREYIRVLRDLTQYGVNVIVTAWEMPLELMEIDGVKTTKAYPMFAPKLTGEICGLFSIVGRIEEGKESRYIRLTQSVRAMAKDRLYNRKACAFDAQKLLKGEVE